MKKIISDYIIGYEAFPYDMVYHDDATFLGNAKKIAEDFDVPHVAIMRQVHSDSIQEAKRNALHYDTDGLYSFDPNMILMGTFADCVPLYFFSPSSTFFAICHAGWKGTNLRIGPKMAMIAKEFGIEDLVCVIGPCIHVKNYEVGEDFRNQVQPKSNAAFQLINGKVSFDLISENFAQIQPFVKSVIVQTKDTFSSKEYHSFRRDGQESGRNVGYILYK